MPLRLAYRLRLLDRAAALLQVTVADGAVEVEDAVLDFLGDVEATDDPDRRVHAEPSELAARPTHTPLEEIVHQALRHSEVVESAIESTLADVRKDLAPTGRDRFQQVAVEDRVVERKHLL